MLHADTPFDAHLTLLTHGHDAWGSYMRGEQSDAMIESKVGR